MFITSIKTAALATAIVLATAGASMAATWAYVDRDANVRKNHAAGSVVVNTVYEGDKVRVIGQWNNWYKLQLSGPDGWVRSNVIDFDYYDDDYYPVKPVKPGYGFGSFCVDGKGAQFCIGGGTGY
jgi:SH3-like domain-containing protein